MTTPPPAPLDTLDNLFLALTPDRILDAAEIGGWRATGRVLQLNSLENRVYDVELEEEDEQGEQRHVILKFYRPHRWSKEAITEEHAFLLELEAEEVPALAPIKLGTDALLHERDGIFFAGFRKGRGRAPEELTQEQLERIGRLLARLHNVGAQKKAIHRITLTPAAYATSELDALCDRWIPPHLAPRYRELVETVVREITPRFSNLENIRIHGDCHLSNLLWNAQGPFFLDFDDFCMGPPMQDVWMLVPGRDDDARRDRDILVEAYETMRAFDHASLSLLEPLRTLRYVRYTAWIARRFHDPAFPRAFPEFDSERYWTRELRDLEEQLSLIVK